MEEFLGILFCGGKGTRLGKISEYVSKPLLPVGPEPCFLHALNRMRNSHYISGIIALTNKENDHKIKKSGVKTIIQDDSEVSDMLSGMYFIKKMIKWKGHFVLVPSDNYTDFAIDPLIDLFIKEKSDFSFYAHNVQSVEKLKDMGSFNPENRKYSYKNPEPDGSFGVTAPYIVSSHLKEYKTEEELFLKAEVSWMESKGFWFDIGDYNTYMQANIFYSENFLNFEHHDRQSREKVLNR